MAVRVILHVGLMKTATTYLQRTFNDNVDALAAADIRWPGSRLCFDAVADRFGRPVGAGTWSQLVDEIAMHTGTVLISNELLSIRRQGRARAIVAELGASAEVVITARDLMRVVPSQWLTGAENGRSTPWPEFIEALTNNDAAHPAVAWFWRRQHLPDIVGIWREAAGSDSVTVVTVPPDPAPDTVVIDRFFAATGLEVAYQAAARPSSRTQAAGDCLSLTTGQRAWVARRAEAMVKELASSGVRLVGSWDDLR
jgi:hypothetical protein